MMTRHYSEADLLEAYYLEPGDGAPVMRHLAECSPCAERYGRLKAKLQTTAVAAPEKPDTFWTRQRISIMRRVAAQRVVATTRTWKSRVAAAAMFGLVVGGTVVYTQTAGNNSTPAADNAAPTVAAPPPAPAAAAETKPVAVAVEQRSRPSQPAGQLDPWQSDEFRQYHAIVEWESWIAEPHQMAVEDESL